MEKYLLRKAYAHTDLLPKEVLWRTKEAFSDGVSGEKKAWFEVIQDHIKENIYSYIKYTGDMGRLDLRKHYSYKLKKNKTKP